MSEPKGMFVDLATIRDDGVRAVCITVLRLIQLTLTFNENRGTHVTVGIGVSRLEVSLGAGLWRRWYR
jgi:hypothetical protein